MINIKHVNQYNLVFLVSLFCVVFHNNLLFKSIEKVSRLSNTGILSLIFTFLIIFNLFVILFTIFTSKYTTKPVLIIILLGSSFASYYMDSYNVMIGHDMIRNIVQTNMNESIDLLNLRLVFCVLFLGVIPSLFIYKSNIKYLCFKEDCFSKIKIISICIITILLMFVTFNKFYMSLFETHKSLKYYVNPINWMYGTYSFIEEHSTIKASNLTLIEANPTIQTPPVLDKKKKLVIMVVGEAARANRFSLNGYDRKTNPELEQEEVISFSNVYSCGTSTAISVPCMFSVFDKDTYTHQKGLSTQNALDILSDTKKVSILWRDNNSDSKGVALRVNFENYKSTENNQICDTECRDEGMLVGLDQYVKNNGTNDILIILHQMGSHGPAYYKRYPKEFEKFTPICKTNQLKNCSDESIGNTYDNTILHTDYFLSKTIAFLKRYSNTHKTAMFYISDHGESLGENGHYLHGFPYDVAPKNQKHIASLAWLGSLKSDIDYIKLKSYKDKSFSHDNVFHTLLGIFDVNSETYIKEKDIFHEAKANHKSL